MKNNKMPGVILYPLDRDITKTWFIQYPNPMGGRPLKKYGKLNKLATVDERLIEADILIRDALAELKPLHLKKDVIINLLHQVVEARCMGKKKKTVWGYYSKLKMFLKWYRDQNVLEINQYTGTKFLMWVSQQQSVNSNTTINSYRRHMKSFFEDLITSGHIAFNPFKVTRKLRETQSTNSWFREDIQKKLKKLISYQDPQLWIVCMVQFYCFIRPGEEMRSLRIDNIVIDKESWRFRVDGIDAKVGRYRFIKIPDPLKELLIDYISGYPAHCFLFGKHRTPSLEPLGANTLYNRHRMFMKAMQLPDGYTLYSWKNTGAVMMYKGGMKFKYISMLMGHTSIETTDEYFKSLGIDDVMYEIVHQYPVI